MEYGGTERCGKEGAGKDGGESSNSEDDASTPKVALSSFANKNRSTSFL